SCPRPSSRWAGAWSVTCSAVRPTTASPVTTSAGTETKMPEIDRRDFLKIAGLTAGAAAATACSEPVHNIFPYVQQPAEVTPGIPPYYTSTCRECSGGCGIRVKTREGRPIKVDGNPDHPLSKGRLCVRGEFGHMRTYDAARFKGPMKRGADKSLQPISWDE